MCGGGVSLPYGNKETDSKTGTGPGIIFKDTASATYFFHLVPTS
jgi:hypothetical protein